MMKRTSASGKASVRDSRAASRVGSRVTSHAGSPTTRRSRLDSKMRPPPSLGQLVPEDPFFWFCQSNFALYTYPANHMPRQWFNEPKVLEGGYRDFVSRAGSPENDKHEGANVTFDVAQEWRVQDESFRRTTKAVPPSIVLCQRTEVSTYVRERWEVRKTLVDDNGMLLGDTNFFAGAYGYRFTFEMKTDDVGKFVRSQVVPAAQLLYLQHMPRKKKKKAEDPGKGVASGGQRRAERAHRQIELGDSSESSGSEGGDEAAAAAAGLSVPLTATSRQAWKGMVSPRLRKAMKKRIAETTDKAVTQMLPAIL